MMKFYFANDSKCVILIVGYVPLGCKLLEDGVISYENRMMYRSSFSDINDVFFILLKVVDNKMEQLQCNDFLEWKGYSTCYIPDSKDVGSEGHIGWDMVNLELQLTEWLINNSMGNDQQIYNMLGERIYPITAKNIRLSVPFAQDSEDEAWIEWKCAQESAISCINMRQLLHSAQLRAPLWRTNSLETGSGISTSQILPPSSSIISIGSIPHIGISNLRNISADNSKASRRCVPLNELTGDYSNDGQLIRSLVQKGENKSRAVSYQKCHKTAEIKPKTMSARYILDHLLEKEQHRVQDVKSIQSICFEDSMQHDQEEQEGGELIASTAEDLGDNIREAAEDNKCTKSGMIFAMHIAFDGLWLLLAALFILLASIWHVIAFVATACILGLSKCITYVLAKYGKMNSNCTQMNNIIINKQCKMRYCMPVDDTLVAVSDEPNANMVNWLHTIDSKSNDGRGGQENIFLWIPKSKIVDLQFANAIVEAMTSCKIYSANKINSALHVRYYQTTQPSCMKSALNQSEGGGEGEEGEEDCANISYSMIDMVAQ